MRAHIAPFTALLVFAILACSPSDGQGDAADVGTTEIEAPAPAAAPAPVSAEPSDDPQILITNVDVFDGFASTVTKSMNVLVQGNVIKQVSSSPISAPKAQVIDGTGKTMTPGLIDMHQHVMLNAPEGTASFQTRWDDAAGGAFAIHHMNVNMLQKGITTIRDIAGDPLDLAKAIQMGLLPGPRVYSSGGAISQIGGHGDWAGRNVPPGTPGKPHGHDSAHPEQLVGLRTR